MPSFAALDRPGTAGGEGKLRVWMDSKLAWEVQVPFFNTASDSVCIGRNPSGNPAVGADLTSVVIGARQKSGD